MDLMQQDQSSAPLRRVQPTRRKWPWPLDLYQSAVGKKWAMAVTGIMLLGFVLVHMLGASLLVDLRSHGSRATWSRTAGG